MQSLESHELVGLMQINDLKGYSVRTGDSKLLIMEAEVASPPLQMIEQLVTG